MTLAALLGELYPQEAAKILDHLKPYLESPAPPLPFQTDPDWYQSIQLYVTYPETFADSNQADFVTLAQNLSYVRQMGCNAIHVLPFFNSPLIDRGFDISDFTRVRENLGGNEALNFFLEKAKQEKVNVFIDLVLNHTSDQNPWFQAAQEGDEQFRQAYESTRAKSPAVSLEKPIKWQTGAAERALVEEHQETFQKLGFEFQITADDILITMVPELLQDRDVLTLIQETLSDLIQLPKPRSVDTPTQLMLAYLARRSAIKGGQYLDPTARRKLLEELTELDTNYTCPHGRPVQVIMTNQELEKLFHR